MIFLHLNLLPPFKKDNLKKLVRFLFIKEMLETIILTSSFLAVTHLVGWIILAQSLTDLAQSALLVNRESPAYNREIKQINSVAKEVSVSAQEFVPLTLPLWDIIQTLPSDIKLNAITIDRTQQSFLISGVAKTRDALLNYEKNITTLSWLQDVSHPTSQLFQKENVTFELRARLKGFVPLKK